MPAAPRLVPRYEFRIFGTDLDRESRALAAIGLPAGAENRSDLYCLRPDRDSRASLKLVGPTRDTLELKLLRGVRAPFELWELAQRRRFPVPGDLLATAFLEKAGIVLSLPASAVGAEEFVARIGAAPGVRLVTVVKHRQSFDLITAIGEVTELRIDGMACRTLAVEGPDRHALARILDRLGLAEARNVSFPRKLREILAKGAAVAVPP